MVKSSQFDIDQDFYIGGVKIGDTWYWLNTFKPIDFEMNWRQGEPNNASGSEICLALSKPAPNSVGFNDGHCGTKNVREHPFMCEKLVVETNSLLDMRFNA